MTVAMQFLKRVLVRAELRQRRHAECDALTGVANRRGFDLALAAWARSASRSRGRPRRTTRSIRTA
jgi:GGDEF domain-containing protein